jgi:hypothetical protein
VSDTAPDPQYVEARRVLLDALDALTPQRDAVVLAGAQAIYIRAGANSLPVSDYTVDGDLALDPAALLDEPELEELMEKAGFKLAVKQGSREPGIWTVEVVVADATGGHRNRSDRPRGRCTSARQKWGT